jgi:ABC-2 type transport system permease protein
MTNPASTTTPPDVATGRVTQRPVRRAGTAVAYRWEITKLVALLRTRAMLIGCLVAPPLIVLVLRGQTPPADTLYGRYVHESGYAVPLLLLGFATQWVFPLLTSLVAGDIFAAEDQHGTWKTVLTRSVSRAQLFWAKTLAAVTFAVATLTVLAVSTILSSLVLVGHQPLVGLTGQLIPSGTALALVATSWAIALAPLLGFTALSILLSVRTRNPAVGVVGPVVLGFAMALVGSIGGSGLLRRALLTTPLESWHGLFTAQPFYGPLVLGLVVSAVWTIACLFFAYTSLRRRDITGG